MALQKTFNDAAHKLIEEADLIAALKGASFQELLDFAYEEFPADEYTNISDHLWEELLERSKQNQDHEQAIVDFSNNFCAAAPHHNDSYYKIFADVFSKHAKENRGCSEHFHHFVYLIGTEDISTRDINLIRDFCSQKSGKKDDEDKTTFYTVQTHTISMFFEDNTNKEQLEYIARHCFDLTRDNGQILFEVLENEDWAPDEEFEFNSLGVQTLLKYIDPIEMLEKRVNADVHVPLQAKLHGMNVLLSILPQNECQKIYQIFKKEFDTIPENEKKEFFDEAIRGTDLETYYNRDYIQSQIDDTKNISKKTTKM